MRSFRVFLHFLHRDFCAYQSMIPRYIINQVILFPLLIIFAEGFLVQQTLFGSNNTINSIRFAGTLLLPLLVMTFNLAVSLLFDLEHSRFIDYQITVLDPRLVLLEKILFNGLFTFVLMVPFYPLAKFLLQDRFITTNTQWLPLMIMLLVGSLTAAAYHILAMCVLKGSYQFTNLWSRCTSPLMLLGGFAVPWSVIVSVSQPIGYCLLVNPFTYLSEGIRQAILGNAMFFNISTCLIALIVLTALFYKIALWQFKKRVDHI